MSPRMSNLVRKYAVPVVILVALSGGGLAMCGLPGDSLDDGEGIIGTYVLNGTDPSGAEYAGTVRIDADGSRYDMTWIITEAFIEGTGELSGDRLSVEWTTTSGSREGATGTAVYTVDDDGVLRGERTVDETGEVATEEIFPEP